MRLMWDKARMCCQVEIGSMGQCVSNVRAEKVAGEASYRSVLAGAEDRSGVGLVTEVSKDGLLLWALF